MLTETRSMTECLRVCVLWDGNLIGLLYPSRRWRADQNIIELLVLNLFIHTLQSVAFGYVRRVVVFPPCVPGKRSCPGEGGHLCSAGHAGVGPCSRGTPTPVRVSQHFALTCTCPQTWGAEQRHQEQSTMGFRHITVQQICTIVTAFGR